MFDCLVGDRVVDWNSCTEYLVDTFRVCFDLIFKFFHLCGPLGI